MCMQCPFRAGNSKVRGMFVGLLEYTDGTLVLASRICKGATWLRLVRILFEPTEQQSP